MRKINKFFVLLLLFFLASVVLYSFEWIFFLSEKMNINGIIIRIVGSNIVSSVLIAYYIWGYGGK